MKTVDITQTACQLHEKEFPCVKSPNFPSGDDTSSLG